MRVHRGFLEGVGADDREERSRGIVSSGGTWVRSAPCSRSRCRGGRWGDRWCEGGMGLVSDGPFWLFGLGSVLGGRAVAPVLVVVQAGPWRRPGRSRRGQGTEGGKDGAVTGSTLSTGCQIGGHEKSRPDSKCKTVWP